MINKIAFVTETDKGTITEIPHESEEFTVHTINLKRKDTLILKYNMRLKDSEVIRLENIFKKKLHRNVIILDQSVIGIEAVNR